MLLSALLELASKHAVETQSGALQAVHLLGDLRLLRQRAPSPIQASLYESVLCLILQGRKQVTFGEQTLSFGPGECLLVSHDVPVRSRVTKAPYLSLVLEVNVATIRGLYDEVSESALDGARARAAETYRADPELLDALRRYLLLADSPAHAKVLAPLLRKELHYRLLTAPFGGMLRSLIRHDSDASAIARAIAHIRAELRSPLGVPELARRVGMSISSFHKHFKAITATTPLQYQKELRLLEARQLLHAGVSVTNCAFDVGYESASQFSREYARKFGRPPSRELAKAG